MPRVQPCLLGPLLGAELRFHTLWLHACRILERQVEKHVVVMTGRDAEGGIVSAGTLHFIPTPACAISRCCRTHFRLCMMHAEIVLQRACQRQSLPHELGLDLQVERGVAGQGRGVVDLEGIEWQDAFDSTLRVQVAP